MVDIYLSPTTSTNSKWIYELKDSHKVHPNRNFKSVLAAYFTVQLKNIEITYPPLWKYRFVKSQLNPRIIFLTKEKQYVRLPL